MVHAIMRNRIVHQRGAAALVPRYNVQQGPGHVPTHESAVVKAVTGARSSQPFAGQGEPQQAPAPSPACIHKLQHSCETRTTTPGSREGATGAEPDSPPGACCVVRPMCMMDLVHVLLHAVRLGSEHRQPGRLRGCWVGCRAQSPPTKGQIARSAGSGRSVASKGLCCSTSTSSLHAICTLYSLPPRPQAKKMPILQPAAAAARPGPHLRVPGAGGTAPTPWHTR